MYIIKEDFTITPNSSNVLEIKYYSKQQILQVQFVKNGEASTYNYYGVPKNIAEGFKTTDSIGKYIHKNIRGKYDYECLLDRKE